MYLCSYHPIMMSKAKDIQNFFYSQYFSDGLRLAFGTVVPALVFSAFGDLRTGIIVSVGAMAVGLSDSPGPLHHRRNGMLFCTLTVSVAALVINLVSGITVLLAAAPSYSTPPSTDKFFSDRRSAAI